MIDLVELESAMQRTVDALKQDYKSTIVARVTPGEQGKTLAVAD